MCSEHKWKKKILKILKNANSHLNWSMREPSKIGVAFLTLPWRWWNTCGDWALRLQWTIRTLFLCRFLFYRNRDPRPTIRIIFKAYRFMCAFLVETKFRKRERKSSKQRERFGSKWINKIRFGEWIETISSVNVFVLRVSVWMFVLFCSFGSTVFTVRHIILQQILPDSYGKVNILYLVGIPDTNVGMLDDLLMPPFLHVLICSS